MTLDIIDENINTLGIQGFGSAANYFFIAHSADGSIDKTDDTATYSFTSIYESQIYDGGDAARQKQIDTISIMVNPSSTGTVTIKYKIGSDTSWTTVGSYVPANAGYDFYNIESTGDAFRTFREIKFRIESTGGAEVTGFKFKFMELLGSI
jgi:hypothetical protein